MSRRSRTAARPGIWLRRRTATAGTRHRTAGFKWRPPHHAAHWQRVAERQVRRDADRLAEQPATAGDARSGHAASTAATPAPHAPVRVLRHVASHLRLTIGPSRHRGNRPGWPARGSAAPGPAQTALANSPAPPSRQRLAGGTARPRRETSSTSDAPTWTTRLTRIARRGDCVPPKRPKHLDARRLENLRKSTGAKLWRGHGRFHRC